VLWEFLLSQLGSNQELPNADVHLLRLFSGDGFLLVKGRVFPSILIVLRFKFPAQMTSL
jgi:hypothetical protein